MSLSQTGFGPRTGVIWGVALCVAVWLGLTAVSGVTQLEAPGVALAVYPKSGFAYEQKAVAVMTGGSVSLQQLKVTDAEIASAMAAVRSEPFATSALTLLGIARDQHGDHDGSTRIVAAAHALDKRQLVANAWLINRYGEQGRDRDVLGLLDEALKIRPELSQRYMPALAQALQSADTIPVFQTLLKSGPEWQTGFWSAVASNAGSLANAEVLRGRMLAGGNKIGDVDTQLMDAFVRNDRADLALSYAKSLPTDADDRDNLVRNASFGHLPQLPPLDWELINDGRLSAAIDESRGTLEVSALPGSGGTVARQLIAIPQGNFSLLVKLGQSDLSRGSDLTVRLRCAEARIENVVINERTTTDIDKPFAVTDPNCRFYWLELDLSALDSAEPGLASVAEIRIARGRGVPTE